MQEIYRSWLNELVHPDKTASRINQVLLVFEQVSVPIFEKFLEGMKVIDFKFRINGQKELLLKLKLEIFAKYFTVNMRQLTEKITTTVGSDTINLLFSGRIEPVAVVCQRIVVRQYAVINQRIEKRLQSKVDETRFVHCDLCAKFGERDAYERISADTLRAMVNQGFHPHNIDRIVLKLAKRNKVSPDVISSKSHTQKWLDFVESSEDVWVICNDCLVDMAPYY